MISVLSIQPSELAPTFQMYADQHHQYPQRDHHWYRAQELKVHAPVIATRDLEKQYAVGHRQDGQNHKEKLVQFSIVYN
jgi:hypothetical protein